MHYKDYLRVTGIGTYFLSTVYLLQPVLAPYIESFGFNPIQLSLFFSVFPLALIFSSVYFGKLSDQVGRKRVIIIGFALEIVAIFFYMVGTPWIFIVLGRIFDAVAIGCVQLIVIARISDLVDDTKRGKFTGWSLSMNSVGILVAPLVGGIIADRFFVKAPFILAIFLLLILVLFFYKESSHTIKIKRQRIHILQELRNFISARELKGMAILGITAHFANSAELVFLPLLIIQKYNLTYSYIGFAMFVFGITHLLQGVFGNLSDTYGANRTVLIGIALRIGGLFFVATAGSYPLLILILGIIGTGGAMWNVSAWSLMSTVGEKMKREGSVVGSYISIAKIGAFFGFIVSGVIVQFLNIETLFKIMSVIGIIGTLLASTYLTNILKYGKESIRHHWHG
ncbi:MAG: MFS transporter [Candidatus Woesearchaeota archaeon]|nr:MAG: MFS transporter [Candidatus Woesearchaeota archaeon]